MNELRNAPSRLNAIAAPLAVAAVLGIGILSGCGDDDSGSASTGNAASGAKTEIESGAKKVEEGVKQGSKEAEALLEVAKKRLESGKGSAKVKEGLKQVEKGIEEGKLQGEEAVEQAKQIVEALGK